MEPVPNADWTDLCSYLTDIAKEEGFKQSRWIMSDCGDAGQVLACVDNPSTYCAILKQPGGWSLIVRNEGKTDAPDADTLALVDAVVSRHAG